MTRTTRHFFSAALAAILLSAPACRRGSPPAYVPAAGRVVFTDNTPVAEVKLLFFPRDQAGENFPTIPFGMTDKAGKFSVLMGADKPGIPPGRYGVAITPFSPGAKSKLPASSGDPATTTVEVVVPAAGSTDLTIRVE